MIPTAAVQSELSLDEVLASAWSMLAEGATRARDPFHTPVLGTMGPAGPSLRTVVLQKTDVAERLLICHTDRRAGKVREIQADPRVSWLFYHPQQKVQLRLSGQATVHLDDALAERRWAGTTLMSRRCYAALTGPGTASDTPASGLPEHLHHRTPDQVESEAGRPNFAVITCRIDALDWLYLRARGHRRAQFRWGEDGVAATWVTP